MPTNEWLQKYETVREKTVCPVDLNTYFELPEIAGKQLTVMNIGPCTLPSGRVLVSDPLVYLGIRDNKPYFLAAPAGTYPTEVSVIKPENSDCARYAAVRLRFLESRPVKFYEALIGHEDLDGLGDGEYFGFNVDAGLGCICDAEVHRAFCDWLDQWDKEHPGGNPYDDYFSPLFAENYKDHPDFQRKGGDWLNWNVPGTEYHIPIFQTGFGDGTYPVYWGIDAQGAVCQLVIQFIDIALAYGKKND